MPGCYNPAMKPRLPSLLMDIKPGVIDLGWGHPSPGLLPLDAVSEAANRLFSRGDTEPLQYGATQGYGPYLEALAEFLSRQESYGMFVDPRSLLLTAGASQGLDLTCTLFAREGDTVLVEEPTYFVIEGVFRDRHLDVRGVPTDEHGLDVDALEDMLETLELRPRLLYTIPSYHNPMGSVLPTERREKLVELAHRFDFLVLTDDVYQMVHFTEVPPKPVISFDSGPDGKTISYGSFSKILSPGLRVGWVQASPAILARLADAGTMSSFNSSLNASARGCIMPMGPVRLGPTRRCSRASTLRSSQVRLSTTRDRLKNIRNRERNIQPKSAALTANRGTLPLTGRPLPRLCPGNPGPPRRPQSKRPGAGGVWRSDCRTMAGGLSRGRACLCRR